VLDTNVVLDAWVFKDPGMAALLGALTAGHVRWLSCAAMRDELARTLGYRNLERWRPDATAVLAQFDRWAELRDMPPHGPLDLRCSDPDDQVFLDLALHVGARWLITHDRALLRLARRARARGVSILRPADWRQT
jgi:putative PIN family toxin of toxin-antitoxin system